MTDPNHIPGYDAWKTSGPEEYELQEHRNELDIGIEVDVRYTEGPTIEELKLEVREALAHALIKIGLSYTDFEIDFNSASQTIIEK